MFWYFDLLSEKRRKLDLPCPGTFEGLHREAKGTLHLSIDVSDWQ